MPWSPPQVCSCQLQMHKPDCPFLCACLLQLFKLDCNYSEKSHEGRCVWVSIIGLVFERHEMYAQLSNSHDVIGPRCSI